eukprot:757450-Hanusia_phi.AAC.1
MAPPSSPRNVRRSTQEDDLARMHAHKAKPWAIICGLAPGGSGLLRLLDAGSEASEPTTQVTSSSAGDRAGHRPKLAGAARGACW